MSIATVEDGERLTGFLGVGGKIAEVRCGRKISRNLSNLWTFSHRHFVRSSSTALRFFPTSPFVHQEKLGLICNQVLQDNNHSTIQRAQTQTLSPKPNTFRLDEGPTECKKRPLLLCRRGGHYSSLIAVSTFAQTQQLMQTIPFSVVYFAKIY